MSLSFFGGRIFKKIFSIFVFFFIVLISFSSTINSIIIKNESVSSKVTYRKNFDFDEFIKYLEINKENHTINTHISFGNNTLKLTDKQENLIIIFNKNTDVNNLDFLKIEGNSYEIIDRISELHAVLLDTQRNDLSRLIEKVSSIKDVEFVDLNHYRYLSFEPNDPYWNESWGHKIINCDKAWDFPNKMDCAWLTILDTGIDADHEDLKSAKIFQYDFVENDGTADDDTGTGHGTNVTGIALARMNNNRGIAGIIGDCPQIEVLKIFDETKRTTVWLITKAIIYSLNAHHPYSPSVISMSFGGEEYSLLENSLIDQLRNGFNGVLFVAAVGNSGTSDRIDFPAGYKSVIAVGAINESERLCRYPGKWGSNYNSKKQDVDIVAPGEYIITTTDNDCFGIKYGYFNGTSAATAYVSGVAAMWYGVRAAKMGYKHRINEPNRCETALLSNTQSVDDGDPFKYGHGLVDAYQTVSKAKNDKNKIKLGVFKEPINNYSISNILKKINLINSLKTNDFLYGYLINNNYVIKIIEIYFREVR